MSITVPYSMFKKRRINNQDTDLCMCCKDASIDDLRGHTHTLEFTKEHERIGVCGLGYVDGCEHHSVLEEGNCVLWVQWGDAKLALEVCHANMVEAAPDGTGVWLRGPCGA